jgi:hypothetical protein
MATTLKINAHRLNFVDHSPLLACGLKSGIFKPQQPCPFPPNAL